MGSVDVHGTSKPGVITVMRTPLGGWSMNERSTARCAAPQPSSTSS
jgi:hypothetical protein